MKTRVKLPVVFCLAALALAGCATTPRETGRLPAGQWPKPPDNMGGAQEEDLPYAKPAPGRPGYAISPYHEGYVDVRGFPRGTKVRCPYTGRLFLAP